MSAATVLWNARVVDGEGIRERMAVRLESGRIASVTPIGGEPPSDAVHLGGKSLLPGLIDVHNHFMSDLDRSPGFGPAPPATATCRGRGHSGTTSWRQPRQTLKSGFTTVRRWWLRQRSSHPRRHQFGDHPRAAHLFVRKDHLGDRPGRAIFGSMYAKADGPWEMRKAVREQLRSGADCQVHGHRSPIGRCGRSRASPNDSPGNGSDCRRGAPNGGAGGGPCRRTRGH